MAGVFTSIDGFIDTYADKVTDIISETFSTEISTLLTASITLYVLFYGYMVISGKIDSPVMDLIWSLAKFAFLIMIINNTDNWLTLTKEAIKSLASLGGSEQGLGFIDDQVSRISELATKTAKKATTGTGWVVHILIWAAFILTVLPAVLIIVINKISMYFLLALLPLFIFCLMWGWLKESFNQYLTALLSNALVIVVVTAVLKSIVDFFSSFELSSTANAIGIGILYLVVGCFSGALVKYLAERCSSLMRVSIEKIPNSRGGSQGGGGNGGGGNGGGGNGGGGADGGGADGGGTGGDKPKRTAKQLAKSGVRLGAVGIYKLLKKQL